MRSVDIMHLSKDTMRGQVSDADITTIINSIDTTNVTHITVVCPLDEPANYPNPQPTTGYTQKWITAIRNAGCKVYFRGTWNAFEGNYDEPHAVPGGSPSKALGTYAGVMNGSDTSSYLYMTWNFIKTHTAFFADGDLWGPMPEPENQGVNGGAQMFASYNELGQWMVDLKRLSDDAFASINKRVLTGFTSLNGGTVTTGQIDVAYLGQIGRVTLDHYVSIGSYGADLDLMFAEGGVDVYIGEAGTTNAIGNPATDSARATVIDNLLYTMTNKKYMRGLNYWQAVGGSVDATEAILDSSYAVLPLSTAALKRSFDKMTSPGRPLSANARALSSGRTTKTRTVLGAASREYL